jgi:hypothetical protein
MFLISCHNGSTCLSYAHLITHMIFCRSLRPAASFTCLNMCELFLNRVWNVVIANFSGNLLIFYDVMCCNSNVAQTVTFLVFAALHLCHVSMLQSAAL